VKKKLSLTPINLLQSFPEYAWVNSREIVQLFPYSKLVSVKVAYLIIIVNAARPFLIHSSLHPYLIFNTFISAALPHF
jgi:hypothetical protein